MLIYQNQGWRSFDSQFDESSLFDIVNGDPRARQILFTLLYILRKDCDHPDLSTVSYPLAEALVEGQTFLTEDTVSSEKQQECLLTLGPVHSLQWHSLAQPIAGMICLSRRGLEITTFDEAKYQ